MSLVNPRTTDAIVACVAVSKLSTTSSPQVSPYEDEPCRPCDCDPVGSLSSDCVKDDLQSNLHHGMHLLRFSTWNFFFLVEGLYLLELLPLHGSLAVRFFVQQTLAGALACVGVSPGPPGGVFAGHGQILFTGSTKGAGVRV